MATTCGCIAVAKVGSAGGTRQSGPGAEDYPVVVVAEAAIKQQVGPDSARLPTGWGQIQ